MSCRVVLQDVRLHRGGREVLSLSHTFPASSTTLLVGPNGAGKSTLLGLVGGLLRPDAGEVLLDDRPARDPRARVGVGAHLTSPLPARRTPAQLAGALGIRADLDAFGVRTLEHRALGTLSAGQRARVGLALALGAGQRLLLLDEPLNALDRAGSELAVAAVQQAVRRGVTVLLATHRQEAWASMGADRLQLGHG